LVQASSAGFVANFIMRVQVSLPITSAA